ncbi:AraC family transcriptional regulator [Paractinoplanes abujensis]|uniref:AraC-like DNA-binding protein n=1 Tax=Paractinoplanes abujensis TaxID=882441 RepID=A0A7W7CSG8_9ACTN|nr:AraC family transcriptional regulator [Actinoplanes abujensis]MBB4692540.1 AraC-like DNA-binding protein [Actinoplanes abujensis]GID22963.1 AraC family transcriptional regulator [Actinoplanes abujensis]
MEPLDELLRGVRADGAIFDRAWLPAPWEVRLGGELSLTLCALLQGEGQVVREDGEPQPIRFGEAVVLQGPEKFVVSGAEDARVLAVTYRISGHVPRRLLHILPPVLVLPYDTECSKTYDYLQSLTLGRQVVLDRLVDWLLVCTLSDWFDRPEAESPAWFRAMNDDVVGAALRAMHADPAGPWTLARLAQHTGASRTRLAKRFADLVGESPMAYLTDWRMALAADLLTDDSGTTVAAVARQVGYADAFGFSAAFKRVRGVSPTEHRSDPLVTGRA